MTRAEDNARAAEALAKKIGNKALSALAPLEREMLIMKWPAEYRAIMWEVVASAAMEKAKEAQHDPR